MNENERDFTKILLSQSNKKEIIIIAEFQTQLGNIQSEYILMQHHPHFLTLNDRLLESLSIGVEAEQVDVNIRIHLKVVVFIFGEGMEHDLVFIDDLTRLK